jgi:hypothetical protein
MPMRRRRPYEVGTAGVHALTRTRKLGCGAEAEAIVGVALMNDDGVLICAAEPHRKRRLKQWWRLTGARDVARRRQMLSAPKSEKKNRGG